MYLAFFKPPKREYAVIILVAVGLAVDYLNSALGILLWAVSALGAIPTLLGALKSIRERHINIDTFNVFALGVSFATQEIRSAAFIVLMLAFAELLDWKTRTRSRAAVEELFKFSFLIIISTGFSYDSLVICATIMSSPLGTFKIKTGKR